MVSCSRLCSTLFTLTLLTTTLALAQSPSADPTTDVNPLIGTANGGNVFPGASAPFGMVQFSPEASPINPKRPIAAPGGYEFRATAIRGFALTNVEGWGCAGGSGDVPLMPTTDDLKLSPSTDFRHAYAAPFSHADEHAAPGTYRVHLGNGVDVALAAGLRIGAATFTFPANKPATVLIRTSDSEVGSTAADTQYDPATNTVTGSVTSGNFCGYIGASDKKFEDQRPYYTLHFMIHFDTKSTAHGTWHDTTLTPDDTSSTGGTGFGPKGFPEAGHGSGLYLSFARGTEVRARIGISYVSLANAEANLKSEAPTSTTTETIAARTTEAWRKRLNLIDITGGTPDQRTVFRTALYHAQLTPTTYSDANGDYEGMDHEVHHLSPNQHAQYANFSGWDVYRSQLQLVTWLDPALGSDIAQSLLNQSRQDNGRWDRWTHLSGATHVMNGDPAAPAIADIYAFGGHNFEAKAALTSLVHAADVPTKEDLSQAGCPVECVGQRPGLDQWLKLHYIPVGAPAWGPAADTLEDATAEFGISALAGHLNDHATERRFLIRAQYWKNIFNPNATPEGGYMMNRNADGTWPKLQTDDDDDNDQTPKPFTPSTGAGFVEGTAAQYVWMVPFNVAGLFEQMGGLDQASTRLDHFFYTPDNKPAVTNAGPLHAELNNEPSIETPWLYLFAHKPWKTQQLVREVLNTIWVNTPAGIPGNDDLGEMSSWYVFAAMGLYPEIPGRAELVLGSPLFPSITVHRPAGDLHITAPAAATNSPYVQSLTLNGAATTRTFLPESTTLHGGRLNFVLSDTPNKTWGTAPTDAPPSFTPR
jgi:predicted alpha-1,2-mannosidase